MMQNSLRSYPAPWQGPVVLACRKCQRKLKHKDGFAALANLKKTVKRRVKQKLQEPLYVINVSCMDLCPKHAVTVCIPAQAGGISGVSGDRLFIVRDEEEFAAFCISQP